jgi:hypothetical protein
VVGILLLGTYRTPAITAYAARAIGAKLSFAYSLVTYKVVNPQFSTSLINTCRSCFAPIKSTLALPFRVFLGSYLPSYRFTVTQCTHGGGVGYCPQVQSAFQSVSSNCILFIPCGNVFVNTFFQIPLSILYVPSARTYPRCVSGLVTPATENTTVFTFL